MIIRVPARAPGLPCGGDRHCQPEWFVLFYEYSVPESSGKLPKGYLKRQNASREQF